MESSIQAVKEILKKYGVFALKRLGQHFLVDKIALNKVVKAADLRPEDTILEIGPGLGVLTLELAWRVKKVIAVEKDPKMCGILDERLKGLGLRNVEVVRGDILKIENWKLEIGNYKVVANLPYYITSPVIRQFLEHTEDGPLYVPERMVLMVQKEVAQRICAQPPEMSLLAISVQFYAKPEIISYVSKESFWPKPEVDSAILRIKPLINTDKIPTDAEQFFHIVKAGFAHPRKQLINNLSTSLKLNRAEVETWLSENKIKTTQRAETLDVKDWIKLTQSYQYDTINIDK